jgi:hypothetical protein
MITLITTGEKYKFLKSSVCHHLPSSSCYFMSLTYKYFIANIEHHPQSIFFSSNQIPIFTSIR